MCVQIEIQIRYRYDTDTIQIGCYSDIDAGIDMCVVLAIKRKVKMRTPRIMTRMRQTGYAHNEIHL